MRKKVVIKSEEERLVLGEVYSPMIVDTDEEVATAEEIKKMAYRFMVERSTHNVDVSHDGLPSGCVIVESFIARKGDPDGFIEGAWVIGAKIEPDELWAQVKKGELNGFSLKGGSNKVPAEVEVVIWKKLQGVTEKSADSTPLPPHVHEMMVEFDENGKVVPTVTEEELGHEHDIRRTTATERFLDHSHRLVLVENE